MSILLKNGRIVTAVDDYVGDIYIAGETISLIGASLDMPADVVVDATDKYVLPGGIDPHTHIETASGGTVTCDDFTSGTVAAAFGGTTTIIHFCQQERGHSIPDALSEGQAMLERAKPVVDVGFHMIVKDLSLRGALTDLAQLPDAGVTSYKLFMAYPHESMVDDATLFQAMQVARETGALIMVHAENGHVIDALVKTALAEGKTDPMYHGLTRPPLMEGEATNRAIQLAHLAGSPIYVVHVSCRESVEPVARARQENWAVWAETCPQYLFLDQSYLEKPDFEAAKYVFTPPPRPKENQEDLWQALAKDVLSVISTDHAPLKWNGQKTLGRHDFSKIPNGAPGVENRLHMVHDQGVRTGRLSLNRMVELLSTNPAKIFGLYPRKGTIAVGSDADFVVFDPEKQMTLSAKTHHSRADYNLFEGTEITGAPETVLVRGRVVIDHGKLVGRPGDGQFIERTRVGERLVRPPSPQRSDQLLV